jgi:hypothetical protein
MSLASLSEPKRNLSEPKMVAKTVEADERTNKYILNSTDTDTPHCGDRNDRTGAGA